MGIKFTIITALGMTPAEALRLCAARQASSSSDCEVLPSAELACERDTVRKLVHVLRVPCAVLITGPTGAGKSALARSVLGEICDTVVCHDASTAPPQVVDDVIRHSSSGSLGPKTGYILEGVDAPRAAARIAAAIRRNKGAMRSHLIMIAIDPEAVRPVAGAVGRGQVLCLRPVPGPNAAWALARAAVRRGFDVPEDAIHDIVARARGDLRAAMCSLEWHARAPGTARVAGATVPDFFARSNQEILDKITSASEIGRAMDFALSDRTQVGAMLASASLNARPPRRHAWRLSQALSDEDMSDYSEAGFAAVVMAARACCAGRTARAPRFPGRDAYGRVPSGRYVDIDMLLAPQTGAKKRRVSGM